MSLRNRELNVEQAIPQITSQFHSLADVGWYSGAYQLTRLVSHHRSGMRAERPEKVPELIDES